MYYAIIIQLKNWVRWHIYEISAWLNRHPDLYDPRREQSTKDMRDMFNLYYQLNFMTE